MTGERLLLWVMYGARRSEVAHRQIVGRGRRGAIDFTHEFAGQAFPTLTSPSRAGFLSQLGDRRKLLRVLRTRDLAVARLCLIESNMERADLLRRRINRNGP
jgi:hypothetical protein